MEKKGLIQGYSKEVTEIRTKRFYELTDIGEKLAKDFLENRRK